MQARMSRRKILCGALGTLAVARGSRELAMAAQGAGSSGAPPAGKPLGTAAKVNEKDSLAVALGYVSDVGHLDAKANPTFQAGAMCSTCAWYQGKPGDLGGGPCTFFPGKLVEPRGWCRMWSKKP